MTMNWLRSHAVVAYYALAVAISWGGMLMVVGASGLLNSNANANANANAEQLTQFICFAALVGSSVAGILMTGLIRGTAGLRDLLPGVLRWWVGDRSAQQSEAANDRR